MKKILNFYNKLLTNNLLKDSFFSTFGNGLGNALLLFSGMLIARLLGKDLYGEYGMVKTTMFSIAVFSTFGLGTISTKFIAEYIQNDISQVKNIINFSIKITILTSGILGVLLFIFAQNLANFINAPQLSLSFRFLSLIIIVKALNTIGAGILGGFKLYKLLGRNNILSGLIMLVLAIPLTYFLSLPGALATLFISQLLLCILNLVVVYKKFYTLPDKRVNDKNLRKDIISVTYPFAITEFIYSIVSYGMTLMIPKYASVGELGLYTACAQWNGIILFMPTLLQNVVLSHLSTSYVASEQQHNKIFKQTLLINFTFVFIPFIIVYIFASYIETFYGITFSGMHVILRILTISTLMSCMQRVFQQKFISENKMWTIFSLRTCHNVAQFVCIYFILKATHGLNAAYNLAVISVVLNIIITISYIIVYKFNNK